MRLSLLHTVPGGASSSLYCSQSLLYSFYVVLLSVNFLLLLNINTAALAPCHIFNRRNITWPHILSVITNPFLSDKHIWPFLPSATHTQYAHLVCKSSSVYYFPTWFTEIATNTPSCCYYHNFHTYSTAGIALTRYELREFVRRFCWGYNGPWETCISIDGDKQSQSLSSLGILLVSLWVSMRTSSWLHLESEGTWYGNESR